MISTCNKTLYGDNDAAVAEQEGARWFRPWVSSVCAVGIMRQGTPNCAVDVFRSVIDEPLSVRFIKSITLWSAVNVCRKSDLESSSYFELLVMQRSSKWVRLLCEFTFALINRFCRRGCFWQTRICMEDVWNGFVPPNFFHRAVRITRRVLLSCGITQMRFYCTQTVVENIFILKSYHATFLRLLSECLSIPF